MLEAAGERGNTRLPVEPTFLLATHFWSEITHPGTFRKLSRNWVQDRVAQGQFRIHWLQ